MVFHSLHSFQFIYSLGSWLLIGSLQPLLQSSYRLVLIFVLLLFFTVTHLRILPLWRRTACQPALHHLTACCGLGLLKVKGQNLQLKCLFTLNWLQQVKYLIKSSNTFLLLRSTGWRHWGELLRVLLTNVDTGWRVKMFLDWSSFRASRDFTLPKSSHRLTSSSPSRTAGILKYNQKVIYNSNTNGGKKEACSSSAILTCDGCSADWGMHSQW